MIQFEYRTKVYYKDVDQMGIGITGLHHTGTNQT